MCLSCWAVSIRLQPFSYYICPQSLYNIPIMWGLSVAESMNLPSDGIINHILKITL